MANKKLDPEGNIRKLIWGVAGELINKEFPDNKEIRNYEYLIRFIWDTLKNEEASYSDRKWAATWLLDRLLGKATDDPSKQEEQLKIISLPDRRRRKSESEPEPPEPPDPPDENNTDKEGE